MTKTFKTLVFSLTAAGCLLGATVANAGVAWSVDIGVPGVAAVVGSRLAYRPVPRFYSAPAMVYAPAEVYSPAPVYAPPVLEYAPAPIGYYEPPRLYRPAPVVVYPAFRAGRSDWARWSDGRGHWNHEHDRDHDRGRDHDRDRDRGWDGHR